MNDPELLQLYLTKQDQAAFTELVKRHLGLVLGSARRRLSGHEHLAEDVAQQAFTLLSKNAASLRRHPCLAGWLHHTTRNLCHHSLRTQHRRAQREFETFAMQDPTATPETNRDWQDLRPLIDEALDQLKPEDRDLVLARYFEATDYETLASRFRLTPNTARMRVTRALERLRAKLQAKGILTTAAALTATLEAHAAAEPVTESLITRITAAATCTRPVSLTNPLRFKALAWIGLATIAVLSIPSAILIHQHLSGHTAPPRTVASSQPPSSTSNASSKTVPAFETESIKKTPLAQSPSDTNEEVWARYRHAKALATAGDHLAALNEFLWCYDIGMNQGMKNMEFLGVRLTMLTTDIAALGEFIPQAKEALLTRQSTAAKRANEHPDDEAAWHELCFLNKTLGKSEETLAILLSMAEKDTRRKNIPEDVYSLLESTGHYSEAYSFRPYERMELNLTQLSKVDLSATPEAMRQNAKDAIQDYLVAQAASDIGILAATNHPTEALALLSRLLAIDASDTTKSIVKDKLLRAGHPELINW